MSFFHDLIFDVIIDGLSKISDKLRKKRPKDAKNGTLGEWIVVIALWITLVAYLVLHCLNAQNTKNMGIYTWIIAAAISAALLTAILLRFFRKRKSRKDPEIETQ